MTTIQASTQMIQTSSGGNGASGSNDIASQISSIIDKIKKLTQQLKELANSTGSADDAFPCAGLYALAVPSRGRRKKHRLPTGRRCFFVPCTQFFAFFARVLFLFRCGGCPSSSRRLRARWRGAGPQTFRRRTCPPSRGASADS